MTSSPRSRRAWKFLALLLALPLLGAVVVAAWINAVADRRWAAAQERIRELSAAFPPPKPRPADATSSEAAKEIQAMFVSAIRAAVQPRKLAQEDQNFNIHHVQGTEADAFLEYVSDVLERIHEGARRSVASPGDFPPSWRGEWDAETMDFVVNCLIVRSRQKRDLGRMAEAVESLLDGLPLMRFWGESEAFRNRALALNQLALLHDELRNLLSREKLGLEELQRIDLELDRSDTWLQLPFRRLEPRLARWSEALLELQPEAELLLQGAPYRWRFLLPERLMKAEAFEGLDRYTQALLSCEDKPYLEWLSCDDRHWEELGHSLNPILRSPFFDWLEPGWAARQRRAEGRLLRAAARYRATGEFLQLEDPFGVLLLHAEDGVRMKFWSLGVNGKDDGASLDQYAPWQRIWNSELSIDLLIDVERRKRD
jgi:hypothetical protein